MSHSIAVVETAQMPPLLSVVASPSEDHLPVEREHSYPQRIETPKLPCLQKKRPACRITVALSEPLSTISGKYCTLVKNALRFKVCTSRVVAGRFPPFEAQRACLSPWRCFRQVLAHKTPKRKSYSMIYIMMHSPDFASSHLDKST